MATQDVKVVQAPKQVTDYYKDGGFPKVHLELFKDFINADVLKSRYDATNGGISSLVDSVRICRDGVTKEQVMQHCEISGDTPEDFFVIDKIKVGERPEYIRASQVRSDKKQTMAGGNFAYSSGSRYCEFTGLSYPISLHDRVEEE